MSASQKTVVLLDVGNTLVGMRHDLVRDAAVAAGADCTTEQVAAIEARIRRELDHWLARTALSTEGQDAPAEYMRLIFAELGLAAGFEPLLESWQALWLRALPGAGHTLRRLRDAGLRLAVVSNSRGNVVELLTALGLAEPFELIVDSGVVGVEKPDPAIFRLALDRLGVEPAEAVHVGDLVSIDVVGARRAGIPALLVDPAGNRDDCSAPRLRDVTELPAWLDRGARCGRG